MELRYRLAIVTGAGGGLGREIAIALARRGVAVLVADRDSAAAQSTAASCREARVAAWAFTADVSEEADLHLLAHRARDLGGADCLVNNAGGWTPGEQYPAATPEAWSRTLDLNLRGPMLLTQLFLDGLVERRGRSVEPGAVVNIASSAGVERTAYGSPEYAVSKAGLVRLTTALSGPEVAERARVMAVVPGWIGLPRAHEELARLSEEQRANRPPLIPPEEVTGAVLDLLAHGRPGAVIELDGHAPPHELGGRNV